MNECNTTEREKLWIGILEQYEKSGLTRKDFCSEHNLSFSQFRNWRCLIIRKHKTNKQVSFDSKFIPLVVTDPPISKEETPANTLNLKLDSSSNWRVQSS